MKKQIVRVITLLLAMVLLVGPMLLSMEAYAADTSNTAKLGTTTASYLNIRAGAGTNYDCIGSYTMGQQVVITEQTNVSGRPWGRTDRGWICLEYVI